MKFNISSKFENLYQMLTKKRPKSECNTTSASMGIKYTGHSLPVEYEQMPDYLMNILDSDEGRAYLQKIEPGATYNPWNDSYCIAWAVNKAIGKEVCKVKKATMPEMIEHLKEGGVVVIGGGFLSRGTSGHFVCVVGIEYNEDGSIKNIIIDDPYGNYNDKYKDHLDGNDIPIEYKTFIKLTFGKSNIKSMQFYYKKIE